MLGRLEGKSVGRRRETEKKVARFMMNELKAKGAIGDIRLRGIVEAGAGVRMRE